MNDLIGKQLNKQPKQPLSWSNEEHDTNFRVFLSNYIKQQKKKNGDKNTKPGVPYINISSICGEDDRTETRTIDINSPNINRATCSLAITSCDGRTVSLGTGFFIEPRKVVTAAHCLFYDTWAESILVRPGLYREENGTLHFPFRGDFAEQIRVPKEWCNREENNFDYDWGLITLSTEDLYDRAGRPSLELWAANNDELRDQNFSVWGYPVFNIDSNPPDLGQFHSAYEKLENIGEYILGGSQDLIPGNSGGPLVLDDDVRVPGIVSHEYTNCSNPNGFTRITEEVKRILEDFEPGNGGSTAPCDVCE
ncbi:trypsin-like serine protease [Bacillus cereus]|uniref:trypsin-like serine peptidase n=1 Tax=Bacillus cereus TaxID=1396 RepID=UPI000BFC16FE|nr:trypsin-like serine protease [Bacillus cereus]MCU5242790.1 trypsin-like serine protease [Bacillus cereus]MCU5276166.1 trypsin-like serine protease [Bacillus cereus]PGQ93700.1 hypothetical protein COA24_31415 [Bacillus cereus]